MVRAYCRTSAATASWRVRTTTGRGMMTVRSSENSSGSRGVVSARCERARNSPTTSSATAGGVSATAKPMTRAPSTRSPEKPRILTCRSPDCGSMQSSFVKVWSRRPSTSRRQLEPRGDPREEHSRGLTNCRLATPPGCSSS